MALQLTKTLRGVDITDAYHRIGSFRFDIPERVYVLVNSHETRQDALDGIRPIEQQEITTSLTEIGATKGNLNLARLYTRLKQLPYFSGAADVEE